MFVYFKARSLAGEENRNHLQLRLKGHMGVHEEGTLEMVVPCLWWWP